MKFSVLRYNCFIENIALNAANATLKYGDLKQKVNDLGLKRENVNLKAQLANMKNLLGFLNTLQYRQLEYIPAVINLKSGFVKYSLNPINETQFQQFDAPIEMSPNTDLVKDYAEYKKIRDR